MIYIETTFFSKIRDSYFNTDEFNLFQLYLEENPEKGDLIPHSRGLRKVRWSARGKGKSGGLRVIYYYINRENKIILLTVYSKNEASDISKEMIKKLNKELEDD